ncbi:MAG: helix-turn-helix domain-containing protein [Hyphomonadaceae bacterium]
MSKKRSYTLKQRAESQDATRQRIVEAAMQLHGEIGPRATSVCAIADRAGVQRLTVYRHFPTDADVFAACSAHFLELNPPPDPAQWQTQQDPLERTRVALAAFYAYYARTAYMWGRVLADEAAVPALAGPVGGYRQMIIDLACDLAGAFKAGRRKRQLAATLEHALFFPTWADLDSRGLSDRDKVSLVLSWVSGALGNPD